MLFRKMLRDLKGNLSQFISIFLMTLMGILIYTGLSAVGQGMDYSSKKFYEECNLADAILYGAYFTKEEVILLEKEEGISKVERRLQVDATLKNESKKVLQLNLVEENQISTNQLIEGEPFDPKKSGIWLDSSYAESNFIKVGDTISLLIMGYPYTETIKGFIMNPEYVYALKDENEVVPDHQNYGYAFLSSNKFNLDMEVTFNELLIDGNANKNRLEEIITDVLEDKQVVLIMQEDLQSVRMFQNEVNQMNAMQTIFPIVFLLIAILTTLTTMTRITVNQRMQIGSLKAFGFSNRIILGHYMSYGAFIGTVGGALGLMIGPFLLSGIIFDFQKGFYTMPEWKVYMEPKVFLVVILCIIGCSISGLLACRKELRGTTAQILRPKPPKNSKHTKIEKSKFWNNMRFDVQWNVRDLIRNKMRCAITIIGIIGCMALVICAFGLRDTIKEITNNAYNELNTYETKVGLSEMISPERLINLQENEKLQFIQELAIEINIDGEKETTLMTVIGAGDYIKHKDIDNSFIDLPNDGIVVTNKLAKLHNLSIGSILKWRRYGTNEWVTSQINQVIRNPIGQGVFVSEEAYKKLNLLMTPTAFVTNETLTAGSQEGFSSIQSKEDLMITMDAMMETMNVMIFILIFAAVILGVVVLYNLGVLSFQERMRELTTLKVLGFQYNKLRRLLQMQNIWLTLLGTLLGVPGGYLLLSYMLKFMGDSFDMLPVISILSYSYSILGTLFLSIVVNWFLSRKLKTIDMVSALKSVE